MKAGDVLGPDDVVDTDVIPSMARLRSYEHAPTEAMLRPGAVEAALVELTDTAPTQQMTRPRRAIIDAVDPAPLDTLAPTERFVLPASPRARETPGWSLASLVALAAAAAGGLLLTCLLAAAVLASL